MWTGKIDTVVSPVCAGRPDHAPCKFYNFAYMMALLFKAGRGFYPRLKIRFGGWLEPSPLAPKSPSRGFFMPVCQALPHFITILHLVFSSAMHLKILWSINAHSR
jgi:hypothetical protein